MNKRESGKNDAVVVAIAAFFLIATGTRASAATCDAHYPLDGSLADATGNGYDGMMIAKDGAPEKPQFADGKFGQALHITENSAMRAFLDLHHETCPQFTITGWFRLPSVGDGAPQGILSTGARGGIPAVVATGSTLMLYGSGNGLWQKDAIRDGNTWYFVAATFDYVSRTYKLYWRNRAQEGKLSEKPYEAEDAFWIGARSDNFRYPAKDLYVDDVRVYGRVLDLNEIREASRNVPIAAANVSTGGEASTGNGRPTFETGPDFSFPSPTGSAPNIPDATAIDDSLQPTSPLQQYATQSLACRIDTDTTIRNRPTDIDYRADCVVDVTAALTIEPGVVIQFAEDAGLGVYDSGSLTANGTTTEPVIFRGVQAAPGYWRGIHFETNSSDNRLSHVEIRHAASSYVYCCNAPAALQIKGGQMTLENSTISASGACDIVVGPNADFQQSDNSFSSNQDNDGCYSPVVDVVAKGSCLTGSVEVFAGNYAPRGWAYANGDTLDTQAYSALFSIVGTTYGGDGQAGFALPNIPVPSSSVSAQFAMICVNGVYPSRS